MNPAAAVRGPVSGAPSWRTGPGRACGAFSTARPDRWRQQRAASHRPPAIAAIQAHVTTCGGGRGSERARGGFSGADEFGRQSQRRPDQPAARRDGHPRGREDRAPKRRRARRGLAPHDSDDPEVKRDVAEWIAREEERLTATAPTDVRNSLAKSELRRMEREEPEALERVLRAGRAVMKDAAGADESD